MSIFVILYVFKNDCFKCLRERGFCIFQTLIRFITDDA